MKEVADPSSDSIVKHVKLEPPTNTARWLFWLGAVVTLLYGYVLITWFDLGTLQRLEPNTLGDFLAGTFAPLAFLWLVLGFIQQGFELRNSSRALWAQMEELRNSVEQQRGLVDATRDLREIEAQIHAETKLAAIRASQPILQLVTGGSGSDHEHDGHRNFWFNLSNVGADCSDVCVKPELGRQHKQPLLKRGDSFRITISASPLATWTRRVDVSFIGNAGDAGVRTFIISHENQSFRIEGPYES